MNLTDIGRYVLEHPRLRPVWSRWLREFPEPVRAAELRARSSFLLVQFPVALFLVLVHAIAKHLGVFESWPLMADMLAGTALIVLLWPVPWFGAAIAALRASRESHTQPAPNLRFFAFVTLSLAVVSSFLAVVFIGLLMASTVGADR